LVDFVTPAPEIQGQIKSLGKKEVLTEIENNDVPPGCPQWGERHPAESLRQLPQNFQSPVRYVGESNNLLKNMLIRKSTQDTSTQAVHGPSQRLASQEQAEQLHSGHLRAHSTQFSPYIPDIFF